MERFVGFFVKRHLLVNVSAVTLIVLGVFFISDVPREFIPSIETPTLFLSAQLPGASAQDIETKLTIPIEEAIEEVDGIKRFDSVIADNASSTTIELYLDFSSAQIDAIEQEIRTAIDGITDFPQEMEHEPTLIQANPAKWPVVEVALSGPINSLIPVAKSLEREIKKLNLVSRATLVGLQDPEVRILVDPVKAKEQGIAILDVVRAIERRNVSNTGGVLETITNRKQIVLWSRYDQPEDVAETILRSSPNLGIIRIKDVARIEQTREDTGLLAHTNAKPGISIVVRKRETADAIDTVDATTEILNNFVFPPGVSYELVNDRSFFPRNRLDLMLTNGFLGAILVAVVLFVFMRGQPAIWVLAGIPVVFVGALAVFSATGMTVNVMALTGFIIVLGMVVDDAVVVAERIVACRAEGLDATSASIKGATEMAQPVLAATLTTVLAFLPLMAMGGLPGKIVWQIPAVVIIVLAFSLYESFCILPAHMTALKNVKDAEKRAFMLRLEQAYKRLLLWNLRHRWIVVLISFSVLIFIFAVIRPQVPFVLFPQDDARLLFMKISAPIGTPIEQTEAIVTEIEKQTARIAGNELLAVTARIGHQDFQVVDRERGGSESEALITAIFQNEDREFTNAEWIQILKKELRLPPGVDLVFQSEYLGPPTDQPVTIHLLSNNNQTRRSSAAAIAEYLRNTPGVTEVEIDERPGTPQIDLNLNYEKLAQLGLDAQDVSQTLASAFFGIEASEHRDIEDTTELRVMFDPAFRTDLQALLETPIRNRVGTLVPLRDVVNPIETPGVNRIYHRDGFRAATIRASFVPGSGHSALSFASHLQADLLPRFKNTPGLEIQIGGEAEKTQETTAELGQAAVLVVLAIGVVIWILLGSFLEALFVMSVIPFAIAGVILTFYLHGMPLSMTAMMGAIGLAGVVVNASIVMVDSVHRNLQLDRSGDYDQQQEIVVRAVVSRLRPILVTTLTTLGGVLPTAYGIGGYDTIVSPMSLAIGWGLTFATLITLLLVPVLYTAAKDINAKIKNRSWRTLQQET